MDKIKSFTKASQILPIGRWFLVLFIFLFIGLSISYSQNCTINPITGDCNIPPTPGVFSINTPPASNIHSTSIDITWGSSSSADKYFLYQFMASFWVEVWNGTTTNATVNSLSPNSSYEFKVSSVNLCNCFGSPFPDDPTHRQSSNTIIVKTAPDAPTILSVSPLGETQFTVNWSVVAGASSYDIQYRPSGGGPWTNACTGTTSTDCSISSLTGNTSYDVEIKASNSSGAYSPITSTSVLTIPGVPTIAPVGSIGQAQFTANWTAPPIGGVGSYTLQVATDALFTTVVQTITNILSTSTSQLVTALIPDTDYWYRVQAVNNSGSSAFTASQSLLTIPDVPTVIAASPIGQTQFTANWTAPVGGAPNYVLEVATNASFTTGVQTFPPVTATSRLVNTSIIPGTNYWYRVSAFNSTGTSLPSIGQQVLTVPGVPTIAAASLVGQTQFTANWTAPPVGGVGSYTLQVATDALFTTVVQTIPNILSTSTSQVVTALIPDTDYWYRVQAVNNSGSSAFTASQSLLTIPGVPTVIEASPIGQTQFTANWTAPDGGASNYVLEVSTNDAFTTDVQTFPPVTGTSRLVNTSIVPGSKYWYRVQAVNSTGSSDFTAGQSLITIPAVSVSALPNAYQIDVSWGGYPGTSYDVQYKKSASGTWIDICTETTSTTCSLLGLDGNTSYDVQVRANNGSYSPYSTPQSALTIPHVPTGLATGTATSTGFQVSWSAVQNGTEFYELEVSRNNLFTNLVLGYDPKHLPVILEEIVTGLLQSTGYYWRVRSGNASGVSAYSDIKVAFTSSSGGGNDFELILSPVSFEKEYDAGDKIFINVKSHAFPATATLFYRYVTEAGTEFNQNQITVLGNSSETKPAEWTVNPNWLDELGLEFYIEVKDNSDQTKKTQENRILNKLSWEINHDGGRKVKDYQIISTPFELEDNIETFFEPKMGTYNDDKWRFVRYQGGKNVDYTQLGLSKERMARGKSYWFLSRSPVSMDFGKMSSPSNSRSAPFILHLERGWNQIATPYPYSIDWDDVLEANNNPAVVSDLMVFNPAFVNLDHGDSLKKFSGGFVHADEAISLTIPVSLRKDISGGRKGSSTIFSESPDESAWLIPIILEQNDISNPLGGFGMHPQASGGKDRFDEVTVPRFINYLEWNSFHPEHVTKYFTRDIVPAQDSYTWTFSEASNNGSEITMRWNSTFLTDSKSAIILHDLSNNMLVNLKATDSYSFTGNRSFNIYFRKDGAGEWDGSLQLGIPYPNPTRHEVTIPYCYSVNEENLSVTLEIFDATGYSVFKYQDQATVNGLSQLKWNCIGSNGSKVPPGLYTYRLSTKRFGSAMNSFFGRIVVH